MAIAVIGGVMTSALLSLIVIPIIFTFVDDLEIVPKRLLVRIGLADDTVTDLPVQDNRETIEFKPDPVRQGKGHR